MWPFKKKKIKILIVDISRNDILDMKDNLKTILNFCDDPNIKTKYVLNNFLVSGEYLIQLRINREVMYHEKSSNN